MDNTRPIFAKGIPLHHQIYEILRASIVDGLYVANEDFPSEVELAARFDVSVVTSRAVLQRLASEGLIERGKGRRPRAIFVPYEGAITPLTANLDLFTFRLLDVSEVIAPWAACRTFGLAPGSVLWRCLRLRLVENRPHSVSFSYEPLDIGRLHNLDIAARVPLPRMLERIHFPTERVECVVGVRRPPAEVSAALSITVWDHVLQTTLISYTCDDRPVDFSRVYFHPSLQHSLATFTIDTAPNHGRVDKT